MSKEAILWFSIGAGIVALMHATTTHAQTSNVETVRAWTRSPVMGDPQTGELRDTSGLIVDAQRVATVEAAIEESTNIVISARTGLTNAMARLLAVTNRISSYNGRIYIAADMDNDPGYSNLWSAVIAESQTTNGTIHYYCHYSRTLSAPPRTIWPFSFEDAPTVWVYGQAPTNNVTTNVLGYACYDISVQKPAAALNMTVRTHKFMKFGTPDIPFDIPAAGIVIIEGTTTNTFFSGTLVSTNAGIVTTEVYSSGAVLSITEEELP